MTESDLPTFAVLGPLRAWNGVQEIPLGPPQRRAILAMLLLRAGHPTTPEQLISGLWEASPPRAALTSVHSHVSRLRAVLRDSAGVTLTFGLGGYALRRPARSLDVERAEQDAAAAAVAQRGGDREGARRLLRRALQRWRGVPLAGLHGPYATLQRSRLVEAQLAIAERTVRLDIELGDTDEAVAGLAALIAENPLREDFRDLHMQALSGAGRRAEALAVYPAVRRLLAAELGIDPSPALAATHQRILRGGPAPTAEPESASGGSPELPRPAQLPSDLHDFTGRVSEADRLVARLTAPAADGAPPVCAIFGVGGSGKTKLAIHVAHAVRRWFPDGQLYIDLAGMSAAPVAPAAALAHFLRSLGIAGSALPDDLAARSALYRSVLATRRVLIVMDNAHDAGQVLPLLPGYPGSGVILTSRSPLSTVSPLLVQLRSFAPAEAMELLTAAVGDARISGDREVAHQLLATVGHLPLAVRIIASQLVGHPASRLSDVADRLADERYRLDRLRSSDLDIRSCFEVGYRRLPAASASAFRLLSWPETSTVSLPCAAGLLGLDEVDTERVLDEVVDAGLLQSPGIGVYQFHDLVRIFAHDRLAETEQPSGIDRAVDRLLAFLVGTVRQAYRAVRPGHRMAELLPCTRAAVEFTAAADAHAWFDRERGFITAVLHKATGMGPAQVTAAALVLLGLDPLLEKAFAWQEIVPLARRLAHRAGAADLPQAQAVAHYIGGGAQWQLGERSAATRDVRSAVLLCRPGDDDLLLAEALTVQGLVLMDEGDIPAARHGLYAALGVHERTGNVSGAANVLGSLAFIDMSSGRVTFAALAAGRTVQMYRRLGDVMGEAQQASILGRALGLLGRFDEAVDQLDAALVLARRMQLRHIEAVVLVGLSQVHLASGAGDSAAAIAVEARDLSRLIGMRHVQARAEVALRDARARAGSTAGRAVP